MEAGLKRGQLRRVTGSTGVSGTFALVDGAKKFGGRYEDAIEDAVIASNDPKDASVPALRDYLSEYLGEYDTDNRPRVLMSALDRAEARGHIERLSGKGFSGRFKLSFPYYPSPKELWGKWYEGPGEKTTKSRKKADESSDDEDSSDSSDDDSESEEEADEPVYIPRKKKRGPPMARPPPPLPKKGRGRPAGTSKAAGRKRK